ncbi:MAG: hypothetical protein WBD26_02150 [Candidatus Acidiferrales bacterium]
MAQSRVFVALRCAMNVGLKAGATNPTKIQGVAGQSRRCKGKAKAKAKGELQIPRRMLVASSLGMTKVACR